MTKAIVVHAHGGPEVLSYEDVEVPPPGPGEVRIRHTAIGLNYIDIYFRTGINPPPGGSLPITPGSEGAGVVVGVGDGVTEFREGDRVAYAHAIGSYAEERNMVADRVITIPDGVSDATAASVLLKGMTASYLVHRCFKVDAGHTVLHHAAAGGVGLIFGQWAAAKGARVIGTVGSPQKVARARSHGYHEVIDIASEDFVTRVKEITDGAKCDVVYDAVGKDTFDGSLDCVKVRGTLVHYGHSSGPVAPISIMTLAHKGSIFLTRPTLWHYTATRADLLAVSGSVFEAFANGTLKLDPPREFKLADIAEAHRQLGGRRTTGATILVP